MRVLLVVPDAANIDIDPEISLITSLKNVHVRVLSGHVTSRILYDAAAGERFDVVHFGVHTAADPDPIMRLNGDILNPDDIGRFLRRARADLVFFNSCNSGVFASRVVQGNIPWAIFSNRELKDIDAWKMPALFYESIDRQIQETGVYSYPKAFKYAVSGDGTYGITSDYDRAGILTVIDKVLWLEKLILIMLLAGAINFFILTVVIIWLWQVKVFVLF